MIRGKVNRWGPGLANKAVHDLRLDQDGLSMYQITDIEDARQIAGVFVLVFKEESRHEWIMLPDPCVAVFNPTPDADENLPSPLRERHHLVKGIDEAGALRLATSVCEHPELVSFVQNSREICHLAPGLIEKYDLKITDYWSERLSKDP